MNQMAERKVFDPAALRSIYKSQTFPTTGYGIAHNLKPELAAKIKEAFFTFPWAGSGLEKEFAEEKFVPITYKTDWDVVRKVDAAMGVSYACK
jgi:phosphonate transport system substrate-binding protein